MTDYSFKASATTQTAQWNNPSSWVGGVVPDAPDADVTFPLVTFPATGRAYLTDVSIGAGESFSVHSIQLSDVLDVNGSLVVSGNMTDNVGSLNVGGSLTVGGTLSDVNGFTAQVLSGGTLSAQTINTGPGAIYGGGQVVAGTLNNAGSVSASTVNATTLANSGTLGGYNSVTVTAGSLTNTGTIQAINNSITTINVAPGGFTNLSAGTLTGGSYNAGGAGATLVINAGQVISTLAANVTLDAGGTSFTSYDPSSGQYVLLTTSLHAITSTGSLSLSQDSVAFGALNVAGTLNVTTTQLTSSNLVVAAGGTLKDYGTSFNSPVQNNGTIVASGKTVLNGDVTGTGHLEVTKGSFLELNSATSETIVLDQAFGGRLDYVPATVQIDKPSTFTGNFSPSGHGDRIIVPNIAASSITSYAYAGNTTGGTLTLQEQGGGTLAFKFNGNFTTADFHVAAGPQTLSIDPPSLLVTVGDAPPVCFLSGTRILTPGGEVAIEDLRVGDAVTTWTGKVKAVVWIGSGTSDGRKGSRAVVVRAGALGDGVPARDLRVTEGHSLYVDGVLIPAAMLINGRSIDWDRAAGRVTFHHVELADHDILVADGAPAESYRDDGNRIAFDRATSASAAGDKPPYAPVLSEGAVVDAVWGRIVDRIGLAGELTDDPDLHLLVDGERLDPIGIEDGSYRFFSPAGARSIRIGSRAVVPALVGTARDHRCLGVALRGFSAVAPEGAISLDYASDALSAGFHEAEHGGCLRWTDGAAELPLGTLGGSGELLVELKVARLARYAA